MLFAKRQYKRVLTVMMTSTIEAYREYLGTLWVWLSLPEYNCVPHTNPFCFLFMSVRMCLLEFCYTLDCILECVLNRRKSESSSSYGGASRLPLECATSLFASHTQRADDTYIHVIVVYVSRCSHARDTYVHTHSTCHSRSLGTGIVAGKEQVRTHPAAVWLIVLCTLEHAAYTNG